MQEGTETEVMWPQAQEHRGLRGWERWDESSPGASRGSLPSDTPISEFWPPELGEHGLQRGNPPGLWHGVWQPQDTNTHPAFHFPFGSLSMGCPRCSHKEGKGLWVLFPGRAQHLRQRQL